jgi:thiol-disulfide isomerase/thioredoxin
MRLALIAALAIFVALPAHAAFQNIDPPQKLPPLVFEDRAGKQHSLSDYKGEYILLNVWASWCPPCVKEMGSLDALQKIADPQKLRVVALSEDRDADTVPAFYKIHNLTHLPIAIDSAGTAPTVFHLQ